MRYLLDTNARPSGVSVCAYGENRAVHQREERGVGEVAPDLVADLVAVEPGGEGQDLREERGRVRGGRGDRSSGRPSRGVASVPRRPRGPWSVPPHPVLDGGPAGPGEPLA